MHHPTLATKTYSVQLLKFIALAKLFYSQMLLLLPTLSLLSFILKPLTD